MNVLKNLVGMLGTGFITSVITSWLTAVHNRKNSMVKCRPILNVETLKKDSGSEIKKVGKKEYILYIPYSLKIENLSRFDCYNVVVKAEIETDFRYKDWEEKYFLTFNYPVIKSGESQSINILAKIAEDVHLKIQGVGTRKFMIIPVSYYIDKVGSYKIKNLSVDFNSQELERLRYKFKPASYYRIGKLNWVNQDNYKPKTLKDIWYKFTDTLKGWKINFLNYFKCRNNQ